MGLTTLLIGGLVTWRISRMIAKEIGPLAIFARLRAYLARRQEVVGGLFDLVTCVACLSVYVGSVVALWMAINAVEWVWYTLAFSALAVAIERLTSSKS